jgi:integrase
MVSMRKIRNTYYARIQFSRDSGRKELKISLRTSNELLARERKIEVQQSEDDLRAGVDLSFPWLNDEGKLLVVHLTLEEATQQYLKARAAEQISKSTRNIYREALLSLQIVLNPSFPVKHIRLKHIDQFKEFCTKKDPDTKKPKYSSTTINIRLRAIKTFLIWLKEREYISIVPAIKMLNCAKAEPTYFSNSQFKALCDHVGPYLRSVFLFYRETGCRLSEPFQAEINGNFLTIRAETSKSKRSRDVYLTPELKTILLEMREKTHWEDEEGNFPKFSKHPIRSTHQIKHYSKSLLKACRKVGIMDRHFHHLRHTAAVRTYLRTRDIYEVARLLGHANVKTTEIYAKFDIKRLEQDFPDLVQKNMLRPIYPTQAAIVN